MLSLVLGPKPILASRKLTTPPRNPGDMSDISCIAFFPTKSKVAVSPKSKSLLLNNALKAVSNIVPAKALIDPVFASLSTLSALGFPPVMILASLSAMPIAKLPTSLIKSFSSLTFSAAAEIPKALNLNCLPPAFPICGFLPENF